MKASGKKSICQSVKAYRERRKAMKYAQSSEFDSNQTHTKKFENQLPYANAREEVVYRAAE